VTPSDLKILHVSSAKTWRGGEQQIAYLVEELNKQGIRQWVLCAKGSAMEAHCREARLPFFTYPKRFSANPAVGWRIRQLCRKNQVSLVHVHDAHSHTFACLAATMFGNAVPVVLSRRVDFPIGNNVFSRWKYNHPAIRKIICVSRFIKKIMAADISEKGRLAVVHSGIDLQRFPYQKSDILHREFHIQKEIPLIANVAAIAPHKDYFTFVNTAEILLKKGLKATFLIIGGDGGEKTSIENYIASKNLKRHIFICGFRTDIPRILPEIELLLFTSKTEGLGTSILDAFACNVPVVATEAGGVPEIVRHGETGFLAPVKAPQELALQALILLQNPSLKRKICGQASAAVKNFSKSKTAFQTMEIYKKVVGRGW